MNKLLCLLAATSLCFLLSSVEVAANDHQVAWDYDSDRERFEDMVISTGDTVTFISTSGKHDVQQHVNNDCDDSMGVTPIFGEAIGVQRREHEFSDAGEFFIACDVGGHCEDGGMLLRVRVCGFFDFLWSWILAILTLFLWRTECFNV